MTSISITSAQGDATGTVERIRIGSDGGAQEMWVRMGDMLRRVPVTAVQVCGSQCVRTLAYADFMAAPKV